ncbi:hypothetical protein JNB62_10930 [Microbacterium jejuense]|uniref:DUF4190 domain-containing protein n=1 Tax=Microbacterium jejuense TaxID=1263637 RepID=A0ABS7HNE1_9MICO|nr:hypothetical protein [Microbacterium jejuense]MBW9094198.1 hypothetical protein [Microbacterium jejuense]
MTDERMPPPEDADSPDPSAPADPRSLSERGTSETKRTERTGEPGPVTAEAPEDTLRLAGARSATGTEESADARSLSERGTSETKRTDGTDDLGSASAEVPEDALRLAGARSATEPADARSLSERGTSETKRSERTDDPGRVAAEAPSARSATGPGESAGPGTPQPTAPKVEPASPDIDVVAATSILPGEHRGGFFRLPTAPVAVTTQSAPGEPENDLTPASAQWLASDEPQIHKGLAGWALAFAIIGLVVSLFVGWGFPIGLVAVVSAVFALRRPLESRAVAVWALVIGAVSILYSAGWLLYAAMRANIIG